MFVVVFDVGVAVTWVVDVDARVDIVVCITVGVGAAEYAGVVVDVCVVCCCC